jgi:restriction system protein
MPELFDKRGGFRKLHTFTLATIVQLETLKFCRCFITHDHREAAIKFYDPEGRQPRRPAAAAKTSSKAPSAPRPRRTPK